MAKSIDHARREVQDAFDRALRLADRAAPVSFWDFEAGLWTAILALGRALASLFLMHQAARPRAAEYGHEGERFSLAEERTTEVGTRFGKVSFTRRVGRRTAMPRSTADLPVDRDLGLCSGFSLGVVVGAARLGAQMAFASARETWREIYEWAPSPRALLRMVDAVGERAREFLEQAAPPEKDGDVLIIQVDGRGAPMISDVEDERRRQPHVRRRRGQTHRHRRRERRQANPRQRRAKGKKSKNAKVAIVGVLYTLRRTAQGMEGPIQKRLYATFESHEALFIWLRKEGDKRGYGRKPSYFLADGSDHIWRLQQLYFPEAETCLDWYHVIEKLWKAGECLHDEGSEELRGWIAQNSEQLRNGAVAAVLSGLREELVRIPRTGPGNKGRRERLQKTINYYAEHEQRMRYDEMRRLDLDIGTGAVEGAVRNLVAMRLDGPGMRWSRQRSELVLHLRCILLNGQWNEFATFLAANKGFRLPAQPQPTMPHTAQQAA